MDPQIDWSELLCVAREQSPVLHHHRLFGIFPENPELPLSSAILSAMRNFTACQTRLIVELYHPPAPNTPDEAATYLQEFAALLREGDNPRLFLLSTAPVGEKDAEKILAFMARLPEPPEAISEKIRIVHDMRRRLLAALTGPEACRAPAFYRAAAAWLQLLGTDKLQLFPVRKTLEYAGIHLRQHVRRIDHHTHRSIDWGREYDSYLRQHRLAGFCEQTARCKAREDFLAAHPPPVAEAELLCLDKPPGLSRQSLHKYHRAFLQSQSKTKDSELL